MAAKKTAAALSTRLYRLPRLRWMAARWPMRCARWRWMRSSRPRAATPACPWAWPMSRRCCSRQFLKFDAATPDWPNRDRFVLSAGHGSMLLYGLLYLTGTPGMTLDEIKNFRQLGAKTAGHPEFGHAAGIETTTGPLGQGIANAVGMALAERLWNARLGSDLIEHHTWCIAGDGCLMEGISPGSHHAGRPPRPRPPDRAVRRQRHLHRRPHQPDDVGRPDRTLQGGRLEHALDRRSRSRCDRRRTRQGARWTTASPG